MVPTAGPARTTESVSAARRIPGSAHRRKTSGLVMAVPNAIIGERARGVIGIGSAPFMWNGKDVSVVLMTYAERRSIREVIDGFFATGFVDEVVVVDNNAEPGTAEEVARTRARLVHEPRQGYGHATRRGL